MKFFVFFFLFQLTFYPVITFNVSLSIPTQHTEPLTASSSIVWPAAMFVSPPPLNKSARLFLQLVLSPVFVANSFCSSPPASEWLQQMASSLLCPICTKTLLLPLTVLPCLHSFCSHCLRYCLQRCTLSVSRTNILRLDHCPPLLPISC